MPAPHATRSRAAPDIAPNDTVHLTVHPTKMHPTSGDAWLLTLTGDEGYGGAAKRQGYWELLAGEHNSYVHPMNRIPHHNAIKV